MNTPPSTPAGTQQGQSPTPQSVGNDPEALRKLLDQVCVERDALLEQQRQVQQLVGASTPQRILHDLRNILNERALLQAIAETATDDK